MTKHELIAHLATETGLSKRQVEQVIGKLVEIVGQNITKGHKVAITGFGTFDLGKRAARRGVNPQTGADIKIPAMPMPRFRAGKRLKELVRRNRI